MNIKQISLNGVGLVCLASVCFSTLISPVSSENMDETNMDQAIIRITNGTTLTADTSFLDIPAKTSDSGYRFPCRVSHISYDDPIVFPGKTGAAHLHTFVGNTETNAFTTASSLKNQGQSTCASGDTDKSSYWMPSLLDENDEVVIPHHTKLYYKQHKDIEQTQFVPDNLQLIGADSVGGCNEAPQKQFDCAKVREINDKLVFSVHFANCLKVDDNNQPVLATSDNSHGIFGYQTCTEEFPYRLPMISLHYTYDIDIDSDWKLSSDVMDPANPKPKGSTLHADVFASWSDQGREDIRNCNRKGQNCSLWSDEESANQSPDGELVYRNYRYSGDNTSVGKLPPMMKSNHNHDMHSNHGSMPELIDTTNQPQPDTSMDHDLNDTPIIESNDTEGLEMQIMKRWQIRQSLSIKRQIRANNRKIQQIESANTRLEERLNSLDS